MSDLVALFDGLCTGLLESFVPTIDQIFTSFEISISSNLFTEDQMSELLQQVFRGFPDKNKEYRQIIDTIASFGASGSAGILDLLSGKIRAEVSRGIDSQPTTIRITALTFRPSNFYHFQFGRFLALHVLSDLIYAVFSQFPSEDPVEKLVPVGFSLCTMDRRFSKLQLQLIKKWSYIFKHISMVSQKEIALSFEQYSDEAYNNQTFWLVSKVRANQQFLTALMSVLQQLKRRKTLTSEILSALAVFCADSPIPTDDAYLNEIYAIAWGVRSMGPLKEGAIELIVTLMIRLPNQQKKLSGFFTSRIYKHAGIETKVERCARAFLRLIRGDISGVKIDKDFSPLNYISCAGIGAKSQKDRDSFHSTFLSVFFPKSNFAVCSDLFAEILVHLAALDLDTFAKAILPQFAMIKQNDPRFVAILNCAAVLNDPRFLEKSYCKGTAAQLHPVNAIIRTMTLQLVRPLEAYVSDDAMVFLPSSTQYLSAVNDADNVVTAFLQRNNYNSSDISALPIHTKQLPYSDLTWGLSAVECMAHSATAATMADGKIPSMLIRLAAGKDQALSQAARNVYQVLTRDSREMQTIFISEATKMLSGSMSPELAAHCLSMLVDAFQTNRAGNLAPATYADMEISIFPSLLSDFALCRLLALRILKYLHALGNGICFRLLHENRESLSEVVNRMIVIMNVPDRPSMLSLPIGSLDFEQTCCSRYSGLWLIFLAELLNLMIERSELEFLAKLRGSIGTSMLNVEDLLESKAIAEFNVTSMFLLYLDSFAIEMQPTPKRPQGGRFGGGSVVDYVLNSRSQLAKKLMLRAFCYLNWRLIPSIVPLILAVDPEFYPEGAKTLSFIVQNSAIFAPIIGAIFRHFVEFLALLQSYFIHLQINSTREMKWDERHTGLLKQYEDLCVTFCVLVSSAFNNIHGQIPEDDWPVSARQILVQFLLHWAALPPGLEKIKAYAIHALIPIVRAGPVFTSGFAFEMSMLDMMLGCQLEGYSVLDSLLMFHVDVLLDVYVKNALMRGHREALLFLDAIQSALSYCEDANVIQARIGFLMIVALYFSNDKPSFSTAILGKIATLFPGYVKVDPKTATNGTELCNCVLNYFQFAHEQFIEAGIEILRSSSKSHVSESIVTLLAPVFQRVRLLPTQDYILPVTSSKFRRYDLMSFLNSLFVFSSQFNVESHEIFSRLWCELLKSSDNTALVLECVFEHEDTDHKARIFSDFLEHIPGRIVKYLAKRCSFAYWYFLRTDKIKDISAIAWMFPLLTQAWIDFSDSVQPLIGYLLHFSLLFVEEPRDLFFAVSESFGIGNWDPAYVWSQEGVSGTVRATGIVGTILAKLNQDRPKVVNKWNGEAARWVVGCREVKLGYRSLLILNALGGSISAPFVSLLCDAVYYHLGQVSDDDLTDVTLFIGECFSFLLKHIRDAEVAPFALKFALQFSECVLNNSTLERTVPIFIACLENPALKREAESILVDSFVPYLPKLENDTEAQRLLVKITQLTDAPTLLLIAAAFLMKPLPFVDVGRTYQEIVSAPISSNDATRTLKFFEGMIRVASRPLLESIVSISTNLLAKFGLAIDRPAIFPIYEAAKQRVAVLKSAIGFMRVLIRVDPSISGMTREQADHRKLLADVRRGVGELIERGGDVVAVTNCKQLAQLRGVIDQKSPPKIIPYTTQFEAWAALVEQDKTPAGKRKRSTKKRWSTMSIMGLGASNVHTLSVMAQSSADFAAKDFKPLPLGQVQREALDLAAIESSNSRFIMSTAEFLSLAP
jgi:hypothetical protein